MAPKSSPTVQRSNKINPIKSKPASAGTTRKVMSAKKNTEKLPLKVNNIHVEPRQKTITISKVGTPKPKENKPAGTPGSVTKSVKKASWKRRPKPAHSGVPVPEKMKKLLGKHFQDSDCSL